MANILFASSQVFECLNHLLYQENGSWDCSTLKTVFCLFLNQQRLRGKSKRFPVLLHFFIKGISFKLDPWAATSCNNVQQQHRFSTDLCNFFQAVLFSPYQIPRIIPDVSFSLAHSSWRVVLSPADTVDIKASFYIYISNLSVQYLSE